MNYFSFIQWTIQWNQKVERVLHKKKISSFLIDLSFCYHVCWNKLKSLRSEVLKYREQTSKCTECFSIRPEIWERTKTSDLPEKLQWATTRFMGWVAQLWHPRPLLRNNNKTILKTAFLSSPTLIFPERVNFSFIVKENPLSRMKEFCGANMTVNLFSMKSCCQQECHESCSNLSKFWCKDSISVHLGRLVHSDSY